MKTLGIGLYWDNLEVSEQFKTLKRTVTEADIVNFIGVTGMVETLFTDLTFGDHGGGPMGGAWTGGAGLYDDRGLVGPVHDADHRAGVTGSGEEGSLPVFAGDTIYAVEIMAVRATARVTAALSPQ